MRCCRNRTPITTACQLQIMLVRGVRMQVGADKPLLAAVHGRAVGGAATMLLHCDLVAAAGYTQFCFPFTSDLAAVPELASSFLRPRVAGARLASELLLLGQVFDAHKALRAAMVTELVPAGEELTLARTWAEQLAAMAPGSKPPSACCAKRSTMACRRPFHGKVRCWQRFSTERRRVRPWLLSWRNGVRTSPHFTKLT